MADSAALLVDEVLPHEPMRQWVLSVPFPLRLLFARQPAVMGKVLSIVYRAIATHLIRKAGYTKATAKTGAVTLIQCFGGTLNLNYSLPYVISGCTGRTVCRGRRKRRRWYLQVGRIGPQAQSKPHPFPWCLRPQ